MKKNFRERNLFKPKEKKNELKIKYFFLDQKL